MEKVGEGVRCGCSELTSFWTSVESRDALTSVDAGSNHVVLCPISERKKLLPKIVSHSRGRMRGSSPRGSNCGSCSSVTMPD